MKPSRHFLIGGFGLVLALASGAVVAGNWQQSTPQPAVPVADPIGDLLRTQPPEEDVPVVDPAVLPASPEAVPATGDETGEAGPTQAPVTDAERAEAPKLVLEPETPTPRRRLRVAVVEAIDKITAERMRFEVVVGGRPVRFNGALVFTARACELSAPNESVEDAIAYMDISLQPRGALAGTEARQVFRGWMFASAPAVSGLQHPLYDAWVVGCKA